MTEIIEKTMSALRKNNMQAYFVENTSLKKKRTLPTSLKPSLKRVIPLHTAVQSLSVNVAYLHFSPTVTTTILTEKPPALLLNR